MARTRGGLQNRFESPACSQGPRKYLSLPKVAHCIQVSFVYGMGDGGNAESKLLLQTIKVNWHNASFVQ